MMLQSDVPAEWLSSLDVVGVGGGRIDEADQAEFEERFGASIMLAYGATEFAGVVSAWTPDLHREFAQRIPVVTIARLIGVPEEDEDRFIEFAHRMIAAADPLADQAANARGAAAIDDLYAYLGRLLEERRRAPREDLLSRLLAVEEEGDRLSREELLSLCQVLLVAGAETTTVQVRHSSRSLSGSRITQGWGPPPTFVSS